MNPVSNRLFIVLLALFACMSGIAQKNATLYDQFLKNEHTALIQDFSYAGYRYNEKEIPVIKEQIDITTYGILPDTGEDLTIKVQKVIDEVGRLGGGVIYFPKGRYSFNMDTTSVQFLKIDYSNVVIRGENAGENGTVFYCGSKTFQGKNPWISPFLIRFGNKIQHTRAFWGVAPLKPGPQGSEETQIQKAGILTNVTTGAKRGETRLKLSDASKVKAGDVILLAMYNTDDQGSLLLDLLNYNTSELTKDLENAGFAGTKQVASFQWLVEIKKIHPNNTIELCQPLRCDISIKYKPVIAAAPMLSEVGVENIRFESAWDGSYIHHGTMIMDYGWNAVNFCRVSHGWMRNIVIDNYINPVYLQDSRNVTIDNLTVKGANGHSGIKIYGHAADNLVKNVRFENNFTHIISGEGNAYGNVFSKIKYEMEDSISGRFDFHGFAHVTYSPPAWNLFELMEGLTRIDGGGSIRNMPHTAKHNVWWNCTTGKLSGPSEFFSHWGWRKQNRIDHHLMYPASIIVGFSSPNHKLLINGSDQDRIERLINVESLNKNVFPVSLFEEQLNIRLRKNNSKK